MFVSFKLQIVDIDIDNNSTQCLVDYQISDVIYQ